MKKWVWIIFFINLMVRLALLNWNAAEYTDSIRWMQDLDWMARVDLKQTVDSWQQSFSHGFQSILKGGDSKWLDGIKFASASGHQVRGTNDPPLYPAAILLFNLATGDRETAGKLVSMLAASLTIFPLFLLARRVYGDRTGLSAILLYTVSPLIMRWSIRVMGEATYTLFMVLSLWLFIEYFYSHRIRDLIGSLLVAAIAPLAHMPGRVLIAPAVFLYGYFVVYTIIMAFRSKSRRKTLFKTVGLILILLPVIFAVWGVNEVWYSYLVRNLWYEDQMKACLDTVQRRIGSGWLGEYVFIYPYVLTYPVALFLLIGIVRSFFPFFKKNLRKIWILLFISFSLMIFAGVVISKWWTTRYLYALMPFSLIVAAYGIETFYCRIGKIRLSAILLGICLIFSTAFTIVALKYSRDSFGDVKRTALFLRDNLKNSRVFTDETMKTGWWAKRPLIAYSRHNKKRLRPNDYVVLHSWGGTNIPLELAYLRRRFDIEIVHEEKAEVTPFLADDLLSRGANAPVVAHHRFEKQKFLALVVKLLKEKGERDVELSEGVTIYEGMLTYAIREVGHNVQTWKIKPEKKRSDDIVLKIAHAAPGMKGTFRMVAYADTDNDGAPDKLIARTPFLEVKEAGSWSTWTFHAEEEIVFVGNMWYGSSLIYYDNGTWPTEVLEETMFYSNSGDIPTIKVAPKITNMLVYFQTQTEAKTE